MVYYGSDGDDEHENAEGAGGASCCCVEPAEGCEVEKSEHNVMRCVAEVASHHTGRSVVETLCPGG